MLYTARASCGSAAGAEAEGSVAGFPLDPANDTLITPPLPLLGGTTVAVVQGETTTGSGRSGRRPPVTTTQACRSETKRLEDWMEDPAGGSVPATSVDRSSSSFVDAEYGTVRLTKHIRTQGANSAGLLSFSV